MSQSCDSLFISPHLDDVVLSCALRILKERQAGSNIAVATVCSRGLALPAPLDLYEGRRQEDRKALSILGVDQTIHLGFQDSLFRNLFYTSFERIIMGEHQADGGHAKSLAARASLLLKDLAPKTVYLPLAVGTHIDHRHTHRLWCSLPAQTKIVFYEDRPYSLLPYNLQLRLIEIGAQTSEPALEQSMADERDQGLRAFADGLKATAMYKNVLTSKKQGSRYLQSAARILQAPPSQKPLTISAELIRTESRQELEKIKSAVGAYASQISMLFKNMDTFTIESASYNSRLDASALYCERYWTLVR